MEEKKSDFGTRMVKSFEVPFLFHAAGMKTSALPSNPAVPFQTLSAVHWPGESVGRTVSDLAETLLPTKPAIRYANREHVPPEVPKSHFVPMRTKMGWTEVTVSSTVPARL